METKAKDLKIGDTIYILTDNLTELFSKDYNFNPPKEFVKKVIKTVKIHSIELDKDGNYLVNRGKSYNGNLIYLLTIEKKELKETILKREKDCTYFFNEKDCNQVIRESVVKYINKLEQSIKAFEIKQLKSCEELRKHYWDFLQ